MIDMTTARYWRLLNIPGVKYKCIGFQTVSLNQEKWICSWSDLNGLVYRANSLEIRRKFSLSYWDICHIYSVLGHYNNCKWLNKLYVLCIGLVLGNKVKDDLYKEIGKSWQFFFQNWLTSSFAFDAWCIEYIYNPYFNCHLIKVSLYIPQHLAYTFTGKIMQCLGKFIPLVFMHSKKQTSDQVSFSTWCNVQKISNWT